jgi:pimeloyl-ACP methyl ester carboxylesterase
VSADAGYKTWVGVPEFVFDAPEPILIDHYVEDTIKELKERGFTGDDIFLASHSLGGVFSQQFAKSHSDLVKG